MLELFGLDITAQLVYRTLLTRPGLGVTELCETLELPESAVRQAIDSLLDTGMLRESREHVGRLRAVDPEVGLEVLLRRQEEELARQERDLLARRSAAAEAVAELARLRAGGNGEAPRRLIGTDALQAEIELRAGKAEFESRTVTTAAALSAEMLEAARPMDELALARGLDIRVLYQDSVRNDPATHAYARWLTDLGGQVRTAPLLPPPMLIYDRTTALVLIDPADRSRGALCTAEPGIVAYLLALFQQTWDTAVPLGAAQEGDPRDGLTAGERELLRLLAGGLTDESAAKRLGVSLSTVRRQMSGLTERLGASSRFEAGLRAAHRGWI
jgi:DNA-binding CsgD family transcriptional regulator/sugar-specific transcriptional regulator TrmB